LSYLCINKGSKQIATTTIFFLTFYQQPFTMSVQNERQKLAQARQLLANALEGGLTYASDGFGNQVSLAPSHVISALEAEVAYCEQCLEAAEEQERYNKTEQGKKELDSDHPRYK
jgi:hypothetical protein